MVMLLWCMMSMRSACGDNAGYCVRSVDVIVDVVAVGNMLVVWLSVFIWCVYGVSMYGSCVYCYECCLWCCCWCYCCFCMC